MFLYCDQVLTGVMCRLRVARISLVRVGISPGPCRDIAKFIRVWQDRCNEDGSLGLGSGTVEVSGGFTYIIKGDRC